MLVQSALEQLTVDRAVVVLLAVLGALVFLVISHGPCCYLDIH